MPAERRAAAGGERASHLPLHPSGPKFRLDASGKAKYVDQPADGWLSDGSGDLIATPDHPRYRLGATALTPQCRAVPRPPSAPTGRLLETWLGVVSTTRSRVFVRPVVKRRTALRPSG